MMPKTLTIGADRATPDSSIRARPPARTDRFVDIRARPRRGKISAVQAEDAR